MATWPKRFNKKYLLLESTSDYMFLFKTNADHDHDKKKEFALNVRVE